MTKEPVKKKTAQPKPKQLLPENSSPKATNVEMEQRVHYVLELILEAKRPSDILRIVAERYKVSHRSAEELWARAKRKMIENNRQTVEEAAAEISAHYQDIIGQTKAAKEFNTSISALKELGKIKGLDQSVVHHIHTQQKELEEIPDAFIDAELVGKDE